MTLYARSDIMSVSIPVTSGGCGDSHSRPVVQGAPVKVWGLDCPPCESYLRGDRRHRILKTTPGDPKLGIPASQERVADIDPQWGTTPDTIPMTPDEKRTKHVIEERGEQQLRAFESLANLRKAGLDLSDRPDVLYFLQEKGVPADILTQLGKKAEPEKEISVREAVDAIPLDMFDAATLKRLCKERSLPADGNKQALIARLEAARARAS